MAMDMNEAYIITTWVEAVLYGINSVLAWSCLFVLTRKKPREGINKSLVGIIILQYLITTTEVSLSLKRQIIAFVSRLYQPGGPDLFFSDEPDPTNVAQLLLISTNSVINDSIIVWRCYHVWGKNWKVIFFPAMLVVATLACGIGQGISFRTLKDRYNMFSPHIVPWNEAFYCLSLATNIVGTSLIAFRIWSMIRLTSMGAAYTRILIMVIESGMLYATTLLIGLGLYFTQSFAFYIVYTQGGQLASIIPSMIVLQVGLKLTTHDVHDRVSVSAFRAAPPSASIGNFRPGATTQMTISTPTVPVTIDMTTSQNQDNEDDEIKVLSKSIPSDDASSRV